MHVALRLTVVTLALTLVGSAQTYTESVLYNLGQSNKTGTTPLASVADKKGNVYGISWQGGDPVCLCGTVFKVTPQGVSTTIHAFTGMTDGRLPSSIAIDRAGNVFGTTISGGNSTGTIYNGYGTIFKIAAGRYSVLYRFTSTAGTNPQGLVLDTAGNLYGIASFGGAKGLGNIWKVTSTRRFSVLYSFADGSPSGNLLRDGLGNFYGTSAAGLYKVSSKGVETLLYNFSNPNLTTFFIARDALGSFYGNFYDWALDAAGVWQVTSTGIEATNYFCQGRCSNYLSGALLISKGLLYGTTATGGSTGSGTVYQFSMSTGGPQTVHEFSGTDGQFPSAGVVMDSVGNLYGTTAGGGVYSGGTVFKLTKD